MSKRKFMEAFAKDKNVPFDVSQVGPTNVREIKDSAHFLELLDENQDKLTVVIYYVDQSAPCSQMRRIFHPLSYKFTNALFLEVNTDKNKEIGKSHKIEHLPTFVFYRNNRPVFNIQGAYPEQLKETLCKLAVGDESACEELKKELSNLPKGSLDVSNFVDISKSECLNAVDDFHFENFIMGKEGCKLVSDCDEQLILSYGFNQNLRLHGIKIKAPGDKGPISLKIFVNQLKSLDFDDVSSTQPTQEIMLSASDLDGEKVLELSRAKFSKVLVIHIFISGNQSGEDVTEIESLSILGEPINKTLGAAGHTSKVVYLD